MPALGTMGTALCHCVVIPVPDTFLSSRFRTSYLLCSDGTKGIGVGGVFLSKHIGVFCSCHDEIQATAMKTHYDKRRYFNTVLHCNNIQLIVVTTIASFVLMKPEIFFLMCVS